MPAAGEQQLPCLWASLQHLVGHPGNRMLDQVGLGPDPTQELCMLFSCENKLRGSSNISDSWPRQLAISLSCYLCLCVDIVQAGVGEVEEPLVSLLRSGRRGLRRGKGPLLSRCMCLKPACVPSLRKRTNENVFWKQQFRSGERSAVPCIFPFARGLA